MSDTMEKIKDGINDAATKAKQATEKVVEKSHPTDRVEDATGGGVASARGMAHKLAEKTDEMTSDVRGHAENVVNQSRQCYEHVAERAHEGFRKARELVRENPSLAVSAAFGIGVGMGIGVVIGLSLGTGRAWR